MVHSTRTAAETRGPCSRCGFVWLANQINEYEFFLATLGRVTIYRKMIYTIFSGILHALTKSLALGRWQAKLDFLKTLIKLAIIYL